MNRLKDCIKKSEQVIQDAEALYSPKGIVCAWTGGKDSTVLLHIIRTLYGDTIPFDVMFNDSTMEFPEIYGFIEMLKKTWHIKLTVVPPNPVDLKAYKDGATDDEKLYISRMMKIHAIDTFVKKRQPKALMAGIRWDEHTAREKETYISKRQTHDRIHPILHFKEQDIWDYIHAFQVPYVSLYDRGYRSLGEAPLTKKAIAGGSERSGREKTKEALMDKLRYVGYW